MKLFSRTSTIILIILEVSLFNAFSQSQQGVPSFSPTQLSNCILWLKADVVDTANNAKIKKWKDLSVSHTNANQSATSLAPIYLKNIIMHKPVLQFFDRFDTVLQSVADTCLTVFIVQKVLTLLNIQGALTFMSNANQNDNDNPNSIIADLYWASNNGLAAYRNNQPFYYASNPNNCWTLSCMKLSANKINTYTNGNLITTGVSSGGYSFNKIIIGSRWEAGGANDKMLHTNIAEIIVYRRALPNNERQEVENYLFSRYRPSSAYLGADTSLSYGLCGIDKSVDSAFSTFIWSTGATTRTIHINTSGKYWVTGVDDFCMQSTDTIEVTLPSVHLGEKKFCLGDSLLLNASLGANYTYKWSTAQNSNLSSNPGIYVKIPGKYCVTIHDTLGCSLIDTAFVSMDTFALVRLFASDTAKLCSGDKIRLKPLGYTIASFMWNTGSTDSTLVISSPGMYSVTVTNSFGCRSSDHIYVIMKGYVPDVDFMAQDSACYGSQLQFTDLSHVNILDTAGYLAIWSWSFGDSATSAGQNPIYTFPGLFHHTVLLIVRTNQGCYGSLSRDVFIMPPPKALFSAMHGCTGNPVPFTDQSSDSLENIINRSWNFGDPASGNLNTSQDSATIHTFNTAGYFNIKLNVESTLGCRDSLSLLVGINQSPMAGFYEQNVCDGYPMQFVDTTLSLVYNPVIAWNWDFGDGHTDSISNPAHIYPGIGSYQVTLQIQSLQCLNTVSRTVDVYANPVADFPAGDICSHAAYQFQDQSTIVAGTIQSWHWLFDTAGSAFVQYPVFVFQAPGLYTITLNVVSDHGCSSSVGYTIEVLPAPDAEFYSDIQYNQQNTNVTFTNTSTGANAYLWDFGDGQWSTSGNPFHIYNQDGIFRVSLVATNQYQCMDTSLSTLFIMPAIYDLVLTGFTTEFTANSIHMALHILNQGNREVDTSLVRVTFHGVVNAYFTGIVQKILVNKEVESIIDFPVPDGLDLSSAYLCVRVLPAGEYDVTPENNESCEAFTTTFTVFNPYPNPVNDMLSLDFILPFIQDFDIEIIDALGKVAKGSHYAEGVKGLNKVNISMNGLVSGYYTVRLKSVSGIECRKFMKI